VYIAFDWIVQYAVNNSLSCLSLTAMCSVSVTETTVRGIQGSIPNDTLDFADILTYSRLFDPFAELYNNQSFQIKESYTYDS
jgi:hypothetical protein